MKLTNQTITLILTAITLAMGYVTLSIDYDRDLVAICTMITIGLGMCSLAASVRWYDELRLKAHLRRLK